MSKLYWLSEEQLDRISPYFPPSRGVARVDDRRVISGIIYVIKNGLRWCDAPLDYGPYKTLYNRFKRWSVLGVFDRYIHGTLRPVITGERVCYLIIFPTHRLCSPIVDMMLTGSGRPCAIYSRLNLK